MSARGRYKKREVKKKGNFKRLCLWCDAPFVTRNKFIRLCRSCKIAAQKMSDD